MIHLDACLLIALVNASDVHHASAVLILGKPQAFGTSSVAWTEVRSKPFHPTDLAALTTILTSGIHPFDEATATLAGELFYITGSKRRTRLDSMIAATAILAGAELATVNPEDFEPFAPHGLKLLVW